MKGLPVVLDTNCLVSALLFSAGRMSWLRLAWQRGDIVPVVCGETVQELVRVLAYPKFRLERGEIESLLADLLPWVRTVGLCGPIEVPMGLRDRHDAVFVQLAREAGAAFLVSGDRHLLELERRVPGVRIITASDLQRELA